MLNRPVLIFTILMLTACKPRVLMVTNSENIRVDSNIVSDQTALTFLQPWKDSLGPFIQALVGRTDTAFYAGKPDGNLGSLCADLMLDFGDSACRAMNGFPAHFAVLNHGGLRNPLPAGEIRLGHLFELMPFENEAVLLKISGQTADSVFRHLIARGGEPVSGLKLEVQETGLFKAFIKGAAFDSRREYWLVTSDYLAQGGDGFSMLRRVLEKVELKRTVRDVLRRGINMETAAFGAVQRRTDRRIVYANEAGIPQK